MQLSTPLVMIASCACVQPVQPVKYCIIQQSFRVALNSVCVSLHNQQHAMLLFEVEKRATAHISQQKPLCLEAVCFLSLQHQSAYLSYIQLTLYLQRRTQCKCSAVCGN